MTSASQLPLSFAPAAPPPRNGAQRRDDVLRRLEPVNRQWLILMRGEAIRIARESGQVSADDLRSFADELKRSRGLVPRHFNTWGAIFTGPQWESVGHVPSVKPTTTRR